MSDEPHALFAEVGIVSTSQVSPIFDQQTTDFNGQEVGNCDSQLGWEPEQAPRGL